MVLHVNQARRRAKPMCRHHVSTPREVAGELKQAQCPCALGAIRLHHEVPNGEIDTWCITPIRHRLLLPHLYVRTNALMKSLLAFVLYGGEMNVERLTGVLGARVHVGPLQELSVDGLTELRTLACEHEVIIIPGQSLTPFEQVEFSRRLGPAADSPFIEPSPDHPEVIKVLKEASDGTAFNFGGAWHSDFSFQLTPPSFTVLHALDIPPYGGDTLWSSMTAAYQALSPQLKEQLATISAVHTARDAYSPKMQPLHSGLSSMNIVCDESANNTELHPLITTHPETQKKVLFYNRAYVRDLIGIADEIEKLRMMDWLHLHTTDAKFTVRHKWSVGDVAIWDNRSTQHNALNDYAGFRRELHRTTVRGERPVA
jgi:taurine dioxygenase